MPITAQITSCWAFMFMALLPGEPPGHAHDTGRPCRNSDRLVRSRRGFAPPALRFFAPHKTRRCRVAPRPRHGSHKPQTGKPALRMRPDGPEQALTARSHVDHAPK